MAKKQATKAERQHMAKVADLGCIVCELFLDAPGSPAEIHHITTRRGFGGRAKHTEVIPLCPIHHRLGNYGEAVHNGTKTWEEKFDTQENLLEIVNNKIKDEVL